MNPSPEAILLLQKYTNVKIAEQVVELEKMQNNAINAYNRCGARPALAYDNAFVVWAEAWQELGDLLSGGE